MPDTEKSEPGPLQYATLEELATELKNRSRVFFCVIDPIATKNAANPPYWVDYKADTTRELLGLIEVAKADMVYELRIRPMVVEK
jgi:hypothetical protein